MRKFLIILAVVVVLGIIVYVIYKLRGKKGVLLSGPLSGPTVADCKKKGVQKTGVTRVVNGITIYETIAYNHVSSTGESTKKYAWVEGNPNPDISEYITNWTGKGYVCSKTKPYKESNGKEVVLINCYKISACKGVTGWTNAQGIWVNPLTGLPVQAGEGKGG